MNERGSRPTGITHKHQNVYKKENESVVLPEETVSLGKLRQ